jgi:hypothetical protein
MNAKTSSEIDGETHSIEHLTETIIDDRYHQKSWFGKFIQAIDPSIRADREPMFWNKRDRNGHVYWQGYDPVSNRYVEFSSDDEARHWLDRPQPFR